MPFSTETWREQAAAKFKQFHHWLKKGDVPYIAYSTVAGLSLWPLVEAAANTPPGQSLPVSLYLALGSVAGGVGGNLIAEQLQRWRDQADPPAADEVVQWVQAQAEKEPELRQALDDILEKLEAIPQAQAGLPDADRDWFTRTLRLELARLGSLPRFEAVLTVGSGAIALGDNATAVGERGINVSGDVGGHIITGDGSRVVEAEKYYEHYHEAAPGEAVDTHALRQQYLRRLLAAANTLTLTGIDPQAASDASDARLHLEAVYTALLTLQTEKMGKGGDTAAFTEHGQGRPVSALAQLDEHPHLVLLGDPGSGKSTFVNFVAACLAGACLGREDVNLDTLTAPLPDEEGNDQEERQTWHHNALLPLRVILRDLAARGLPKPGQTATADHLWQFLERDTVTASFVPFLRQELADKGGLILLDGLDEVPEAEKRRVQIKQLVEDLAATLPRARILVTSRIYAYQQQDWRLAGFRETVLAPFSAGQIRRFVDRWYAHIAHQRGQDPADAQGRAELLKGAIFSSSRLRGLAERPLLLTLMASLHAWRGGSLPEKREQLYADAVDLLLDWWESQRIVRDEQGQVLVMQPSLAEFLKIDRDGVRQLLNELAFKAHRSQPETVGTADVPEGDLVAGLLHLSDDPDVKPARLLEFLSQRAGLLLPRGVGVYTFPHRTFQEYLAACWLTDHDYPELVAELVRADPDRWREVALLAGAKAARGAASTIWSLAEALCYQSAAEAGDDPEALWGAQLAGQALAETANLQEVSPRNQTKVARVKDWLKHIMGGSQLPATERAAAGVNLAVLGDDRPEAMTVDGMQFCYVPKGAFWMDSDEDSPLGKEEKDAERPRHKVEIPYDYWIGRYPVTNAQFDPFVADGGYKNGAYWTEAQAHGYWKDGQVRGYTWIPEKRDWEHLWRERPYDYGRPFNLPNHPVVGLTWYEALAYARWLTEQWRQADHLPEGMAVTLPSEAEWEKAARGGLRLPDTPIIRTLTDGFTPPQATLRKNDRPQRRFPWGEEMAGEQANGDETGIGATNAVGIFTQGASPYGVMEMSGNVYDWTRSLWGRYDSEKSESGKLVFDPLYVYPYAQDERERLDRDGYWVRVLRGGSWGSGETWLRCAYRLRINPLYGSNIIGFRIVVSPFSPSGL